MRRSVTLTAAVCIALAVAQAPAQSPPVLQTTPGAAGAAGPAQQPAQQPVSPQDQQKIESILASWENDAKSLKSLSVKFKVEVVDAVFKQKTYEAGEAKVMKMPTGAYGLRLEIYEATADGRPDFSKLKKKYICSGIWFYEYDPASKTIFSRTVENQNQKPDDGPFAFVFGLKAIDAKKRFAMSVAKADEHWTWLTVLPLTAQDQRDFVKAWVGVINYANRISPKDFPLQIKWEEPSHNTRHWQFTEVIRNDDTKVRPMDFTPDEDKKQGWKVQLVPSSGAMQPPGRGGVIPAGGSAPRK